MITVTQHEKNEWSRFAQAAYARRDNATGHRFSVAASLPHGARMPVHQYDSLMRDYRAWLCFDELPAQEGGAKIIIYPTTHDFAVLAAWPHPSCTADAAWRPHYEIADAKRFANETEAQSYIRRNFPMLPLEHFVIRDAVVEG